MSRKYTFEEVKEFVESNGHELLSKEYINYQSGLIIKDKDGYKYKTSYSSLKSGRNQLAFSSLNPYILDNIQLLIDSKLENCKLISTNYKGKNYPIVLQDSNGYYYTTYVSTLRCDSKPAMCDPSNPYSIENIKKWLILNDKKIEFISGEYKTIKSTLKWKCLDEKCGEEFDSKFYNFYYQDSGCPYCVNQKIGVSNCLATKNPELAKEWHTLENGTLTPHDVSENYKYSVWWQCSKNKKHIWKNKVKYRNEGFGCPYCNKSRASEEYNLLLQRPEICTEWDYDKNQKTPDKYLPFSDVRVWWKCDKCKREWNGNIGLRSHYNTLCSCGKFISKGEKKVKNILDFYNVKYIEQYTYEDCRNELPLRFDFHLPYYSKNIEYNGEMHYHAVEHFGGDDQLIYQQKRDQIKRDYCNKNNIGLIEIAYWDFDKIEDILIKELGLKVKSAVNT